ncbi:MAG: hypothetical protein KA734_00440 [Fluviicola sp.]|nr:hypothetical protein [Fluviicola sp.]
MISVINKKGKDQGFKFSYVLGNSITFFVVFFVNFCFAQNTSNLNFTLPQLHDSIDYVMVGEDHFQQNAELRLKFVERLIDKGFKTIFIEIETLDQVIVDRFFNDELNEKDLNFNFFNKKDQINFLIGLKKKFGLKIKNHELSVFCCEVFYSRRNLKTLKRFISLFNHPLAVKQLKFIELVGSSKETEKIIYGKLIDDLKTFKSDYIQAYGNYYHTFLNSLYQVTKIQSYEDPVINEEVYVLRDKLIDSTIRVKNNSNSKSIVFTGRYSLLSDANKFFDKSLYYYLGAGGNQIMRFYLLYFPANPFSGLVNFSDEKALKKRWKTTYKKTSLLFVPSNEINELDYSTDICDYFLFLNKRKTH